MTTKPRYRYAPVVDGWAVIDDDGIHEPIILASEDSARDATAALNSEAAASVAPSGRWTEKEAAQ